MPYQEDDPYRRKKTTDSHLLKKNLMPFGSAQLAGNGVAAKLSAAFHSPQQQTKLPPLVGNVRDKAPSVKLSVASLARDKGSQNYAF